MSTNNIYFTCLSLLVFRMPTHYLVDFCVEQVKFETPMGLNLLIMIIYALFLNNVIVMK
jgi:hypothetical protein